MLVHLYYHHDALSVVDLNSCQPLIMSRVPGAFWERAKIHSPNNIPIRLNLSGVNNQYLNPYHISIEVFCGSYPFLSCVACSICNLRGYDTRETLLHRKDTQARSLCLGVE